MFPGGAIRTVIHIFVVLCAGIVCTACRPPFTPGEYVRFRATMICNRFTVKGLGGQALHEKYKVTPEIVEKYERDLSDRDRKEIMQNLENEIQKCSGVRQYLH